MKTGLAMILLLLHCSGAFAEWQPIGVWEARIRIADDPAFATPLFDDTAWKHSSWGTVTDRGPWWMRVQLSIPERILTDPSPAALYIVAAASSEVFWNGERLGSNGEVGATPEEETPGRLIAVFPLSDAQLRHGPHLLAIRFSAHYAGTPIVTPVDAVFLAPYGPPLRFSFELYLPALLAAGALLTALILLIIMWAKARQRGAAWLILASAAALTQLAVEVLRAFVNYGYQWHQWRLLAIGIATAVTGTALTAYLLDRFRISRALPLTSAIALVMAGVLLAGYWLGIGTATGLTILVWLLASIGASMVGLVRSPREAWPGLVALLVMVALFFLAPSQFIDQAYYLGVVALLILYFAEYTQRFARTERERDAAVLQAARLELELLKRHLRPHFLMNTLTTLSEWLETDPATGSRMIEALAREFRQLDRLADQALVDLDEEIDLCRAHLEVMAYRKECHYDLRITGETAYQIPPVVIHTLLENALSHNDYGPRGAVFELQTEVSEDDLIIQFRSPPGRNTAKGGKEEGTGLGYVRARLEEVFPERCEIKTGSSPSGWTTRIRCPAVPA